MIRIRDCPCLDERVSCEVLGNCLQVFTRSALIIAAYNIDRTLDNVGKDRNRFKPC
jgi:hypothetical protein